MPTAQEPSECTDLEIRMTPVAPDSVIEGSINESGDFLEIPSRQIQMAPVIPDSAQDESINEPGATSEIHGRMAKKNEEVTTSVEQLQQRIYLQTWRWIDLVVQTLITISAMVAGRFIIDFALSHINESVRRCPFVENMLFYAQVGLALLSILHALVRGIKDFIKSIQEE